MAGVVYQLELSVVKLTDYYTEQPEKVLTNRPSSEGVFGSRQVS